MTVTQPMIQLGRDGPKVPRLGFGAMGISDFYSVAEDAEGLKVLNACVDAGCNFIDTSDIYGPQNQNEILIGKMLAARRSEVFLCTKFGIIRDPKTGAFAGLNSSPEYVKQACEASLKRLGTDYIDLYYQHRVDSKTPIEETVKAMAELKAAGKIRHLGLSECSAETLRRACAVHPISAVQLEYSPWTLDLETNGLLEACRELGVTIVAYSPLGRGFLTGKYRSVDDFDEKDWRRFNPRFQGENFKINLQLADKISELAARKGVTASQFCLAWVMAQDMIAIPGTKRVPYLEENLKARDVVITKEDDAALRAIVANFNVAGTRYDANGMRLVNV